MTKIKTILKALFLSCLFFVFASFVSGQVSAAPRIYLDPASKTAVVGTDFNIDVKVDTASTQIFGADAVVTYPTDGLTVKSVNYGSFFTDTIPADQSSGRITLRGSFFSATSGTGSGTGTFATITFTAQKAAGTSTVSFDCSGTDMIDAGGANILACSSLNQSAIAFSTGATAPPTNPPGSTTAPTNACGGSCGSIYNCNVNLFCYQGFCRNPDCPNSSTCGCPVVTASPKPTIRSTPRATIQPTPEVIALSTTTPFPTINPLELASPLATFAPQASSTKISPVVVWGILGLIAIIIIITLVRALGRKSSPPKINPPAGGSGPIETYHVSPPLQNNPPQPPPTI